MKLNAENLKRHMTSGFCDIYLNYVFEQLWVPVDKSFIKKKVETGF
jgi:hypothetical protein